MFHKTFKKKYQLHKFFSEERPTVDEFYKTNWLPRLLLFYSFLFQIHWPGPMRILFKKLVWGCSKSTRLACVSARFNSQQHHCNHHHHQESVVAQACNLSMFGSTWRCLAWLWCRVHAGWVGRSEETKFKPSLYNLVSPCLKTKQLARHGASKNQKSNQTKNKKEEAAGLRSSEWEPQVQTPVLGRRESLNFFSSFSSLLLSPSFRPSFFFFPKKHSRLSLTFLISLLYQLGHSKT